MPARTARVALPLVAAVLVHGLTAQTFVVDASNGPGAHFTSIPAAIAAVPDGATLLVRPGTYTPFALLGKSLRILGDNASVLQGNGQTYSVYVNNVPASGGVVIKGFAFSRFPLGGANIEVHSCQGPILVEDVSETGYLRLQILATNVQHLQIRNATGTDKLAATNSNVVVIGGTYQARGQTAAISSTNGTMQIVDAAVTGAIFTGTPNAIDLQGGSLRLLGTTTLTPGISTTAAAISGFGSVRREPTVTLAGGALPSQLVMQTATMALVRANRVGNNIAVTASATNGTILAIAVSLPTTPTFLPGIQDPVWLDAGPLWFPVLGYGNPAIGAWVAVPTGLTSSVRVTFQAVGLDPAGTMAFSNPTFVVLP